MMSNESASTGSLAGDNVFVSYPQSLSDRRATTFLGRLAQMFLAQFFGKVPPQGWAALFQHLRPHCELFADRHIFATPDRHLRQHRQKVDAFLGEAIERLLLVAPGRPLLTGTFF